MTPDMVPKFGFPTPKGYSWLVEKGLVGFEASTSLQPWYCLDQASVFVATDKWPKPAHQHPLIAFARRQDTDDIACFEVDGTRIAIVVIHGWTTDGFDVVVRYADFWLWLKSVIEDIAELADN